MSKINQHIHPEKALVLSAMQEMNAFCLENDQGSKELWLFEDFHAGSDLFTIYQLADQILSATEKAMPIKRDSQGNFVEAVTSPITDKIVQLKHVLCDFHTRYYCHPYVTVILEACQRHGIVGFGKIDVECAKRNEQVANAINQLVDEIYKELRSYRVQESVQNKQKNAYKNYRSAMSLLDALFERYARLCIVRLDLFYKYEPGQQVPFARAALDIRALLDQKKSHPAFKHYLSHIGKMEYGREKGIHYHFIFIFDGSKVQADVVRAKLIGDLWQNEITQGDGRYHNCNKDKDKNYGVRCGVGMVHHAEEDKRKNLNSAIGYITKSSQYLMGKLKPRSRLFYRGLVPAANVSGVGRPRQEQKS